MPAAVPFAPETRPVRLAEQVLRRRCCYCPVKHPTDGLGPILPGERVSDGLCQIAADQWNREMDALEAAK